MRRVALIGVVASLVMGLAWWAAHKSQPAAPHIAIETAMPIDAASQIAPPALESVDPQASRSEVTIAATPTADKPPATAIPESKRIKLYGHVVVIDGSGGEHAHENGSLDLELWNNHRGEAKRAAVLDGEWALEVDSCEKISVDAALLGERAAFDPTNALPIALPDKGPIDFRLTWAPVLILHARDAASNRHLGEIEVITANGGWSGDVPAVPERTSGKGVVVIHGSSPLTIQAEQLAADQNARFLCVRAAGYAWAHAEFDRRFGGDVFVELVPAASLDVELSGSDSGDQAVVRLWPVPRSIPSYETYIRKRSLVAIDDLPAGKYVVSAQVGMWFQDPLTLAEAEVELVAGARTRAQLRMAEPPRMERAALSGVLRIPVAWKPQRVGVIATPLGKSSGAGGKGSPAEIGEAQTTATYNSYPWRIEQMHTGRHEVISQDPPFAIVTELLPGGTSGVIIDIPPPANVSVRVIDAETGEPVDVASVMWRSNAGDRGRHGAGASVQRNAVTGTYDFQCPIGEVEISTFGGKTSSHERASVSVREGNNSFTLSLTKGSGVVLKVMDGDRVIRVEGTRAFKIVEVGGDGKPNSWTTGGPTVTVGLPHPGRYSIALAKPIPGYLMPAEQIVDLAAGTMSDVVIRLTRKP
jgi:hypothetical protein